MVLWERGETMMTIQDFENDPSHYIWGDDCRITVDSFFEKKFDGDLKLLLDCCEDNRMFDEINYYQAVEDYKRRLGRD